jgi:excisionase family DNA binding protein
VIDKLVKIWYSVLIKKSKGEIKMNFLTLTQVAQILGVSERTIYRLMEKKELHPFKMGKSWKFDQADIDAYIQRLRETSEEKSEEVKPEEPAA